MIRELKGFLGLASYYKRFIKDFSKIAKPFNNLIKGIDYEKGIKQKNLNKWIDITKEWKEKQENSFQILKEQLCTALVLAYPDFEKQFILYTDVSGYAL